MKGKFEDVVCPVCGSGAMFYQKFPTFYRCECQDCGAEFYVTLHKKGVKFVAEDMENPSESKYYETTIIHEEFCPEHGRIKFPLFIKNEKNGIGLIPICPKCKKPL